MKNNYDELLKEALEEIKKEEIDLIPSEDKIDYEFSDDFKKKMDLLINGERKSKKNHYGVFKKVAVIAIVFISLLAVTTTKAGASPSRLFDFIIKVYNNIVNVVYENKDNNTTGIYYSLTILPEGYEEIGFSRNATVATTVFEYRNRNDRIRFKQSTGSGTLLFNSDNYSEYTVNGIDVLILKNDNKIHSSWKENGYIFSLDYPSELGEELTLQNVGALTVRNIEK